MDMNHDTAVARDAYELYLLSLPHLVMHQDDTAYDLMEHCMQAYRSPDHLSMPDQIQRANGVRLLLFELLRDGTTPGIIDELPPEEHALIQKNL